MNEFSNSEFVEVEGGPKGKEKERRKEKEGRKDHNEEERKT